MATTTAAQRRQQARLAYDAYLASCPSRQLLDQISGNKWLTLLLTALADGPRRYSELGRQIAGVSQKMLTQSLRAMERDGLVTRTITPTVPVRVDYELTPLGRSLLPVVAAMKAWAESNMDRVNRARERYDAEQSAAERQPTERPRAEGPTTERPAAGRPRAERPAAVGS